jgi:hypothetical protein
LQLGGAASGTGAAVQYVYTQSIIVAHPNNDRISIFGAPMLAPVSRNDTGYAWNGSSSAQRAADLTTNLNILRTKFATEIQAHGNGVGALMRISGTMLMHLDGILFTSNDGIQGAGVLFNCAGYMNITPRSIAGGAFAYDGLAAINFSTQGAGFNFDVGSCVSLQGASGDQNFVAPLISIGNYFGIVIGNGGFITSSGNAVCLGNGNSGFMLWPRSGTQWDGALFCNANAGHGIQCYMNPTAYLAAPLVAGGYTGGPSHCYRNAAYGLWMEMSNASCNIDFGAGANANAAGQIYAGNNSGVQLWGSYANYTPCTPAFNTIGNNNSMIAAGW